MLLARLARAGATVAIAGGLVFAIPVTAQALVLPSPTVAGEMVIGAVRAAAPRIATVASFAGRAGPVGAVITIGQIMYMTRDSWMPWVANEFGQGGPSSVAGGAQMSLSWAAGTPSLLAGGQVIVHYATATSVAAHLAGSYQCKSSLGTITGGAFGTGSSVRSAGGSGDWLVATCASDSVINYIQVQAGSGGGTTVNTPYSNQLTWGLAFDPQTEATYRVDVDCQLADGTIATISKTTVSPQGGGLAVPSCAAAYPGSHGVKMLVNGAQTGSPLVKQYQADWEKTSVLYPNCVGAGVACSYVLRYNNIPCLAGQTECIGWALKQDLDSEAGKYECWYGPYQLLLGDCGILERSYEKNGTTLTTKNTDGDPRTFDVTDPNGAPIPGPGAAPAPAPAPVPDGAPGGDPAPIPPGDPSPTPAPAGDPNTNDCWGTGGGAAWNPAAWVLTPVKCALKWAFVPSSSWMDNYGNGFRAKWEASPPGKWITAAGGLVPVVTGTGCQGPALSTGFLSGLPGAPLPATIHPFDACSPPMSTVAATSYMVLSAGIAFYGGMKVVRQLGYAFGFQVHVGSERSTFT